MGDAAGLSQEQLLALERIGKLAGPGGVLLASVRDL